MKTVDFINFTVTTNGEEKSFFEEGLIHNEVEMLSVVDARKHYEKLYNDDPFFYHDPKDIKYILDLYQKLELAIRQEQDIYLNKVIQSKMIEIEAEHLAIKESIT